MILKSFEIDKKNINKFNLFVLYGENEGLKKEIIDKIKNSQKGKEIKFEETQILKNRLEFYSEINNKSLFDEKRIFQLERCTEKISDLVIEICENITEDLIIVNCGLLEKKSKFRNFLEKSDHAIIIPTYKDNTQSLVKIAKKFFDERRVNISYETLSLLANRCNGDRGYLNHELDKITNFLSDKKVISLKEISALTNLSENYSANELVDASLSINVNKTREILNENIYSQEDMFLIIRVFLQKSKKILNLLENIRGGKGIEEAISDYKPPIFWKDKPIIKKQLQIWTFERIQNLIVKINEIEFKIKKNNSLALILMKDFIYEIIDINTNNSSLPSQ